MRDLAIIGVGMTPFGIFPEKSMEQLGAEAVLEALADAGLEWKDIQVMGCSVSHWHGLSGLLAGNLIAATLGETGIPIFNCSNVCGTGAIVFSNVCTHIASGNYDMGIAVGLDKVPGGFFKENPSGRRALSRDAPGGYYGRSRRYERRRHSAGHCRD